MYTCMQGDKHDAAMTDYYKLCFVHDSSHVHVAYDSLIFAFTYTCTTVGTC